MIGVASDHAGFELKQQVMQWLAQHGYEYKDFGTYTAESCDYPDYAHPLAYAVERGECERGIAICGTGIGMSICANKVNGIRAALCENCFSAELTRRHNDANVLCMGARTIGSGLALKITETFLTTDFEGGRHARRVAMITEVEKKN